MKRAAAVLLGVLILSQARGAPAAGPASDERALHDLERQWLDALGKRDREALDRILDEDFLEITWNGRVRDKRAALGALADPGRPRETQRLEQLRVRFAGDAGIVTGLNVVKAESYTAWIRFTDVFVKRNGVWRALSAQETLVRE